MNLLSDLELLTMPPKIVIKDESVIDKKPGVTIPAIPEEYH